MGVRGLGLERRLRPRSACIVAESLQVEFCLRARALLDPHSPCQFDHVAERIALGHVRGLGTDPRPLPIVAPVLYGWRLGCSLVGVALVVVGCVSPLRPSPRRPLGGYRKPCLARELSPDIGPIRCAPQQRAHDCAGGPSLCVRPVALAACAPHQSLIPGLGPSVGWSSAARLSDREGVLGCSASWAESWVARFNLQASLAASSAFGTCGQLAPSTTPHCWAPREGARGQATHDAWVWHSLVREFRGCGWCAVFAHQEGRSISAATHMSPTAMPADCLV